MAKETKLQRTLRRFPEKVLHGRMLVVDPSSGSTTSMPGYAEFLNGVLVDSGTIQIPYSKAVHKRLRYLRDCLDRDFANERYDVLVLESLSIMQSTRRRAMSLLLESVGVFLACIESDEVAYVAPASWHAYVRRKYGDSYVKSDEADARVMGELVIEEAKAIVEGGNNGSDGKARAATGKPAGTRSKRKARRPKVTHGRDG
jgi:hypothetical protein